MVLAKPSPTWRATVHPVTTFQLLRRQRSSTGSHPRPPSNSSTQSHGLQKVPTCEGMLHLTFSLCIFRLQRSNNQPWYCTTGRTGTFIKRRNDLRERRLTRRCALPHPTHRLIAVTHLSPLAVIAPRIPWLCWFLFLPSRSQFVIITFPCYGLLDNLFYLAIDFYDIAAFILTHFLLLVSPNYDSALPLLLTHLSSRVSTPPFGQSPGPLR